jgi:hypothetical protein
LFDAGPGIVAAAIDTAVGVDEARIVAEALLALAAIVRLEAPEFSGGARGGD